MVGGGRFFLGGSRLAFFCRGPRRGLFFARRRSKSPLGRVREIDETEIHLVEPDPHDVLVDALQTDPITRETCTNEWSAAFEMHMTGAIHLALNYSHSEAWCSDASKRPSRALIHFSRRLHRKGLVRPDMIELMNPTITRVLLDLVRQSRVLLELNAHVAVHSFMPTIVLRLAGPTEDHANAERNPPGRELCQSASCSRRSKGASVINVDCSGQSVLLK